MLTMTDYIDIIVPRGGKSLIERVQQESRIPVIAHLEGLCHTYVDGAADPEMACEIIEAIDNMPAPEETLRVRLPNVDSMIQSVSA